MKSIKIIASIIIFLAYIWYIYILAINNTAVFNLDYISTSNAWYVWLWLILTTLLVIILYISNILTKNPKIVVSILGVLVILLWKYVLLDEWKQGVYISDITALMWVLICVLTRFGILLTKPIYAKWEYNKKVEIIEA